MTNIKRFVIAGLLLLSLFGLKTSVAQAAGICVQPGKTGRCYNSIQAAVDAAGDGEQISIRPGKYVEQVSILGKNLALMGQPGAVIEAPRGMQDTMSAVTGVEGRPIVLVAGADVTLRGLTIDGVNSGEANPFLYGIVYASAGGEIRDNLVKNIGFGSPQLPIVDGFPSYQGNAITVANQMETPRSILIAGNKLVNFNSVGITVFAETDPENPASSTLTANILNNVVIAQGANDVLDQWGIFLGGYNFADPQSSVTGAIRGNQVRDAFTTTSLPGIGIVTLFTHDVEISENTIENVNVGMAANLAFTARITGNQVNGPKQSGTGSSGLILSGSDTFVSGNSFKRLDLGLMLMVDDPSYGSAFNTALEDNRFDKVPMDMMTGATPGADMKASAFETQAQPKFRPR
jgi:nitrous oxidase accessory protein NosD